MLAAFMLITLLKNIMLGGYTEADISSKSVSDAMTFLQNQNIQGPFPGASENAEIKVLKARTQVVAGLNIELTILVGNQQYIVTIYNRFGDLRITSVKPSSD